MKFFIDSDPERFPGATVEQFTYRDERTCATFPSSWTRAMRDAWTNNGANHRVENGHMVRDLGDKQGWFIEITSLEELLHLAEALGGIHVSKWSYAYVGWHLDTEYE